MTTRRDFLATAAVVPVAALADEAIGAVHPYDRPIAEIIEEEGKKAAEACKRMPQFEVYSCTSIYACKACGHNNMKGAYGPDAIEKSRVTECAKCGEPTSLKRRSIHSEALDLSNLSDAEVFTTFKEGAQNDGYRAVAAKVLQKRSEDVTHEERRAAKLGVWQRIGEHPDFQALIVGATKEPELLYWPV